MNADPPRDKRLSTAMPLARRSGVGIVRRTDQPFADPYAENLSATAARKSAEIRHSNSA